MSHFIRGFMARFSVFITGMILSCALSSHNHSKAQGETIEDELKRYGSLAKILKKDWRNHVVSEREIVIDGNRYVREVEALLKEVSGWNDHGKKKATKIIAYFKGITGNVEKSIEARRLRAKEQEENDDGDDAASEGDDIAPPLGAISSIDDLLTRVSDLRDGYVNGLYDASLVANSMTTISKFRASTLSASSAESEILQTIDEIILALELQLMTDLD